MNIVKHLVAVGAAFALLSCVPPKKSDRVGPVAPRGTASQASSVASAAPSSAPEPAAKVPCRPKPDAETEACLKSERPTVCAVSLARERIRVGEEQPAAHTLGAAIRQVPSQRTPYLELALLLQTNNRYDLAEQVLAEAARLVPAERRFLVHYLLASTYAAERKMQESVAHLEKAYMLDPDDADTMLNLGVSYTRLSPRRTEDAKRLLTEYIAKNCGDGGTDMCGLAASYLDRIAGNKPWPPTPKEPLQPVAYPPPSCVAAAGEAGAESEPKLPPLLLPTEPVRRDSRFTVWGASHHLRSKPHRKGVTSGPITVAGYVVGHNYAQAPKCALHRMGKPTAETCKGPTPTFFIADDPVQPTSVMAVMGWASTWSAVYEVMARRDRGDAAPVTDTLTGLAAPDVIPAMGAKVAVTGTYGFSFVGGRKPATDPRFGILTYQSLTTLAAAPKKATLPGVVRASAPPAKP